MTANHAHTPSREQFKALLTRIPAKYGEVIAHTAVLDDFDHMIDATIAAAEQRGAEAALMCENEISMEHHEQTDDFPCTRCLTRAQEMIDEYRADQMEGDE